MTITAACAVEIAAQRFDGHALAAVDVTIAARAALILVQAVGFILAAYVMALRVGVVATCPRRGCILGAGRGYTSDEQTSGDHDRLDRKSVV